MKRLIEILAEYYFETRPEYIISPADYLVAVVCKYLSTEGLTLNYKSICVKTRKREIVEVRQICCYFLQAKLDMKWCVMAKFLNIDHATCLHSVRVVNNFIDTNREFKNKITELENLIKV
jgi:chromosomal replication initiation ATPase DnaA